MTILLCFIFFVLGATTMFFATNKNLFKSNPMKKPIILRKGLIERSYTLGTESFSVDFEIGEIERSQTKSKVIVLSIVASNSGINSNSNTMNNLKKFIDNTWISHNLIEWLIEDASVNRDKKINEILK